MNKKNRKRAQNQASRKPSPKTTISDSSLTELPASEDMNSDAVIVTKPHANEGTNKKGEKMSEIRWTDRLITFATIVIAVATGFQAYELIIGGADTHKLADAAVAANRAWVAPLTVHLGSPLEGGPPVKYQIHIANPGKEPALGVTWKVEPKLADYIPDGGTKEPDLGANSACNDLESRPPDGTVLYPQEGSNAYSVIPLSITDEKIINGALSRKGSLVIDGCFAYTTGGKTHTSTFRYFLRDVPNAPSLVIGSNGQTTSEWRFNLTLSGNEAN